MPDGLRLPPELHSALLGSVMLAAAKRMSSEARRGAAAAGGRGGDGGEGSADNDDLVTYKEATDMLGWVMDQAYLMRQEVVRRVK